MGPTELLPLLVSFIKKIKIKNKNKKSNTQCTHTLSQQEISFRTHSQHAHLHSCLGYDVFPPSFPPSLLSSIPPSPLLPSLFPSPLAPSLPPFTVDILGCVNEYFYHGRNGCLATHKVFVVVWDLATVTNIKSFDPMLQMHNYCQANHYSGLDLFSPCVFVDKI